MVLCMLCLPPRLLRPRVRSVIIRCGEGDKLFENGGKFKCSISWLGKLLKRMKLTYRTATTAAQHLPDD